MPCAGAAFAKFRQGIPVKLTPTFGRNCAKGEDDFASIDLVGSAIADHFGYSLDEDFGQAWLASIAASILPYPRAARSIVASAATRTAAV